MQILVIGNTLNGDELKQKFGPKHTYLLVEPEENTTELIKDMEIVFDFVPDKNSLKARYSDFTNPVFIDSSLITLSELLNQSDFLQRDSFFGFCGLPTFINRPIFEVSLNKNKSLLNSTCLQLVTDFVCVEDRVGFVTPRVICMVINEAYCTLEGGIATRDDIDLAMKLGTNYPYGPFEWAKRIGIKHVIELLDAVYRATDDDRYKVCTLLRSEINH